MPSPMKPVLLLLFLAVSMHAETPSVEAPLAPLTPFAPLAPRPLRLEQLEPVTPWPALSPLRSLGEPVQFRLDLPIGPVRIDYGTPLRKGPIFSGGRNWMLAGGVPVQRGKR